MFNTNIFIKNLYKREIGSLKPNHFISTVYEKSLDTFEISKYYSSSSTTNSSIQWFNLETLDFR